MELGAILRVADALDKGYNGWGWIFLQTGSNIVQNTVAYSTHMR